MAITALPLDCWLKERLKNWVQLSGHEGTIVPATDQTLWKQRSGTDCNEARAYEKLMNDAVSPLVPRFYKEIEYKGESFIEIEDLTSHFTNPAIMDVKLGTRTFLEAEVMNPVLRKDLYQKMIKLDPSEPTEEEHANCAVTKLRYMQFRERESSTASLGFRIEAAKFPSPTSSGVGKLQKNFQKVKTRDQVMEVLWKFLGPKAPTVRDQLLKRLRDMRAKVAQSEFFRCHEVIGSSLLFMFDNHHASVWMIDFAKSLPVETGRNLDHRSPWSIGNHEDGYLTGLDNLIE
uniref:Kinase n=1 Tax=Plectus sambesii TaxID=2011161 RepID=A0A914UWM3_9BILA